jgi:hypothetical protein
MATLCSFLPVGIEGKSQWRMVASRLNGQSWFGSFNSLLRLSYPLNQQLPYLI